MPKASSKVKQPICPEKPDGSGPSGVIEKKDATVRAFNRVYKGLARLLRVLARFFYFLSQLNQSINLAALPLDDEIAPETWKEDREELKKIIMRVYDASDEVLEMALRAENHLTTVQHEAMMQDILVIRRMTRDAMPQELYDHLVGKGKAVAKRS
ncbi:hypothetical protein EsH8_II_001352 [Colletotrichum jinshuiense]